MNAPDGCPFHYLDPTDSVWIDFGGVTLPYSAEVACSDYHFAVALEPVINTGLAAADEIARREAKS